MEIYRICNICSDIGCYTDKDVKDNKTNAVISGITSIGSIINVFDGSKYDAYELNKMSQNSSSKIVNHKKCTKCGSLDTTLVTSNYAKFVCKNTNNLTADKILEEATVYLNNKKFEDAFCFATRAEIEAPNNYDILLVKFLSSLETTNLIDVKDLPIDLRINNNFNNLLEVVVDKKELIGIKEKCIINYEINVGSNIINFDILNSSREDLRKLHFTAKKSYDILLKIEFNDKNIILKQLEEKITDIEKLIEKKQKMAHGIIISTMVIVVAIVSINWGMEQYNINALHNEVISLLKDGEYEDVLLLLDTMEKEYPQKIKKEIYNEAINLKNSSNYKEALLLLNSIEMEDTQKIKEEILQAMQHSTYLVHNRGGIRALTSDGEVIFTGSSNNLENFNPKEWTDVISINGSTRTTIGIKSDGTLVATGFNIYGQLNVENWHDIITTSVTTSFTVGLKSNGTVVATGENDDNQLNVYDWTDIIDIRTSSSTLGSSTLGLKSDGTVVATGENVDNQLNVYDWTDIIAISSSGAHTVGLKSNGTVVATGNNYNGRLNVSDWINIKEIYTSSRCTMGLKTDGTVVVTGNNDNNQLNVEDWTDIIYISLSEAITAGLKSDGTVVAVGDNSNNQLDVKNWTDIVNISVIDQNIIGIKSDGSVVATGTELYDVETWTNLKIE